MGGIIRVDHTRDYTCIKNAALRDRRLSFKARGIHHFLLSFPDNWRVNIDHIASESEHDGKTAVMTGLQELEVSGYLYREQDRNECKQFKGWDYTVYELPEFNPYFVNKEEFIPKGIDKFEESIPQAAVRFSEYGKSEHGKSACIRSNEYTKYPKNEVSTLSLPNPLSKEAPAESPPPTPKEREREPRLKPKENSQRSSKRPPLRSDKKAKSLHKTKNFNPDTHFGGVAVAKVYETQPGVINQDFLTWRSQHYLGQGGKWANAPVANALAEIQKDEVRALALWQDYQRSLGTMQQRQVQVAQFVPAQLTDRQHKEWAQEYQSDPEKFMTKPEAAAWWAYINAQPNFKTMIFGDLKDNGATQQGQSARIQRKEAAPLPNRGGRGSSRGNPARSAGGNGSDNRSAPDERILRERAQHYLQWLAEPPQGG